MKIRITLIVFLMISVHLQSQIIDELIDRNLSGKDIVLSMQSAALYPNRICSEQDFLRNDYREAKHIYALFFNSEYEKLYKEAKRLSLENNSVAQLMLGLMYFGGLHIDQSFSESSFWWKKAASHNLPEAYYLVGLIDIVLKNDERGLTMIKNSAELGYNDAILILSTIYYNGYGNTSPDINRFYLWIKQAGINGYLYDKIKIKFPLGQDIGRFYNLDMAVMLSEAMFNLPQENKALFNEILLPISSDWCQAVRDDESNYNLSFKIMASSIIRNTLGSQGVMREIKEQPIQKSNSTIEMFKKYYPLGLFETIYSKRYKPKDASSKVMDAAEIVKRLCPGDIILVSNRISHHFVFAYSINIDNNTITILDGWAKESFLLENSFNNILFVKGTICEFQDKKHLVEISIDDFEKIIVSAFVHKIE